MTKFGAFKIVEAEPLKAGDACMLGYKTDGRMGNQDGYAVKYQDGYTSWCPKEAFEKANTPIGRQEGEEIHPSILGVLKHFQFDHLKPELQEISAPFAVLAWRLARSHSPGNGAECTNALRRLLEAKDSAVRAALP